MKQTMLCFLLAFALAPLLSAQHKEIEKKISSYFFDIPYNADINTTKQWLSQDPAFKFYKDPNRDARKAIVGSFLQSKDLNPVTITNQLIIAYTDGRDKGHQNISMKWTMHYKLEDLHIALTDLENFQSRFKDSFDDIIQTSNVGQQNEQIFSTLMKLDDLSMTFKIIKYNNFIHTISVEYNDVRKVKANLAKEK